MSRLIEVSSLRLVQTVSLDDEREAFKGTAC